jgi:hypothetical protein
MCLELIPCRIRIHYIAFILRLPVATSLDGAGWRGSILTSHKVENESSTLSVPGIMLPLVKDRLGLLCKSKIIISPISTMSCFLCNS